MFIAARAQRTKRVNNSPDCFAINISNKTFRFIKHDARYRNAK